MKKTIIMIVILLFIGSGAAYAGHDCSDKKGKGHTVHGKGKGKGHVKGHANHGKGHATHGKGHIDHGNGADKSDKPDKLVDVDVTDDSSQSNPTSGSSHGTVNMGASSPAAVFYKFDDPCDYLWAYLFDPNCKAVDPVKEQL